MITCRTCMFFVDKSKLEDEIHHNGIGSCRRYPRIIIQQSSSRNFYPDVMKEGDWCEEWIQNPKLEGVKNDKNQSN